jgi:hypothetical protein
VRIFHALSWAFALGTQIEQICAANGRLFLFAGCRAK